AVMITRTNAAFYTKMHKAILSDMEANGVDVFNVSLIERAAFKAIRTYGGIVHNLDRKDVAGVDKAALNVEYFAEEVKKKLKENMVK
ncbi:hypothetical protein NQN45_004521, partial [Vibrio vulnificus]|nr:hypothetical protein [Vibrio vulnificus]EJN6713627.1 hypothetical protein [Vibrio vulnificus]